MRLPSLLSSTLKVSLLLLLTILSVACSIRAQVLWNYQREDDSASIAPLEGLELDAGGLAVFPLLEPHQKYIQSLDEQSLLDILQNYYFDQQQHQNDVDELLLEADEQQIISGPVNDPRNFEAVYTGQYATTKNKTRIDKLVGAYLEHALQGLAKQQQDQKYQIIQDRLNGDKKDNLGSVVNYLATRDDSASSVNTGGEYIDHPLALAGHQYVQGGAGEGKQLLGPDGTFENVQVVKSDNAVPSYCDPPNPCPMGYTSQDGCLEEFVNSASFSRDYQAKQQCSCDNEHSLFNCASPVSTLVGAGSSQTPSTSGQTRPNDQQSPKSSSSPNALDDNQLDQDDDDSDALIPLSKLKTLARAIKNRFGGLEGISRFIVEPSDSLPQ